MYLLISSLRTGCGTMSHFKLSTTSLNWKCSFSLTGQLIRETDSTQPYYLLISTWGRAGFVPLPKILARRKQLRPRFELGSSIPFSFYGYDLKINIVRTHWKLPASECDKRECWNVFELTTTWLTKNYSTYWSWSWTDLIHRFLLVS